MINPSELRIGNYILFNKQPIMVKGIKANAVMLDGVMCSAENPNCPFEYQLINAGDDRLQPIPLIDGILQEIRTRIPMNGGCAYQYYGSKATFLIYKDDEGYYIGMNYMDQVFRVTPQPLLYLHQLQNIYFSQYGGELDFNERLLSISIRNAVENEYRINHAATGLTRSRK